MSSLPPYENPYASPSPAEDPPTELTATLADPPPAIRPTWWEMGLLGMFTCVVSPFFLDKWWEAFHDPSGRLGLETLAAYFLTMSWGIAAIGGLMAFRLWLQRRLPGGLAPGHAMLLISLGTAILAGSVLLAMTVALSGTPTDPSEVPWFPLFAASIGLVSGAVLWGMVRSEKRWVGLALWISGVWLGQWIWIVVKLVYGIELMDWDRPYSIVLDGALYLTWIHVAMRIPMAYQLDMTNGERWIYGKYETPMTSWLLDHLGVKNQPRKKPPGLLRDWLHRTGLVCWQMQIFIFQCYVLWVAPSPGDWWQEVRDFAHRVVRWLLAVS